MKKTPLITLACSLAISAIAFACSAPDTTDAKSDSEVVKAKPKAADAGPVERTSDAGPRVTTDDGGLDMAKADACMLSCIGNDTKLREVLTCTDKCFPNPPKEGEEERELTAEEDKCLTTCFDAEDALCNSEPSSCTKLDQCGEKCYPGESGSSDDTESEESGGPRR